MAKQPGKRNRSTPFGKRQGADDDFRKKKSEKRSSSGRSEGGDARRSSFGKREGGDARKPSFGRRSDDRGDKKPFGGKRKEGGDRGERRSFRGSSYEGGGRKFSGGSRDEKKPFQSGKPERKSFGSRADRPDRPDRRDDNKRPYRSNKSSDERTDSRRPGSGDSSPRGRERSFGDKKPYRSNRSTDKGRDFRKSDSPREKSFPKKPFRKDKEERSSFVESKVKDHHDRVERPEQETPATLPIQTSADGLIRLNKFISNSGVCSRREADELIKMGLITVNGVTITEMGHKVKPDDDVRHEGKRLTAERPVYILLNKPKGFITTTDDPQERNTVMELVAGACKERVYPVGRLDRNTTGLLLLTNDGDLTDKLTHPSFNAKKIYKAELDKALTKADFQRIIDGVTLEEGKAMVDDLAIVSDDNKTVGIELHIGWNHIVRRIFNALEYDVVKLDRVVYAGLDKKDLKRGQWRFLKNEEIVRLKHFK